MAQSSKKTIGGTDPVTIGVALACLVAFAVVAGIVFFNGHKSSQVNQPSTQMLNDQTKSQ